MCIRDRNSRYSYEANSAYAPTGAPSAYGATARELADMLHDLGYSCCANAKTLGEVLSEFGPLDPPAIAAVITMMARTAASLDDSLSLFGAFSTATSGRYLEFDAKFDVDKADKEDLTKALTSFSLTASTRASTFHAVSALVKSSLSALSTSNLASNSR